MPDCRMPSEVAGGVRVAVALCELRPLGSPSLSSLGAVVSMAAAPGWCGVLCLP